MRARFGPVDPRKSICVNKLNFRVIDLNINLLIHIIANRIPNSSVYREMDYWVGLGMLLFYSHPLFYMLIVVHTTSSRIRGRSPTWSMMNPSETLLPSNEAFKNSNKSFHSPENAGKRPSVPDRINLMRPSQTKGRKRKMIRPFTKIKYRLQIFNWLYIISTTTILHKARRKTVLLSDTSRKRYEGVSK